MDQTLITVLRYSITYYQKDLFICAQYANKHKATALHKAYWLPCYQSNAKYITRIIKITQLLQEKQSKWCVRGSWMIIILAILCKHFAIKRVLSSDASSKF